MQGRRGSRLFLAVTLLAGGLVLNGNMASAVHDIDPSCVIDNVAQECFELGPLGSTPTNIVDDGADAPDWNELFTTVPINGRDVGVPDEAAIAAFGGPGAAASFVADDLAVSDATDRTTFAGSNKNSDPISGWQWSTGNVPVKDDLSNIYAYALRNEDGDLIIYAGLERLSPNGDSHVDFEFSQAEIGLDKAVPCGADGVPGGDGAPCEFTGEKTPGDFIVSLDYTKGGGLGTLEVREWTGSSYGPPTTLPGQGCLTSDDICGFTNGTSISGGDWHNFGSHGETITNLPTNAFAEFGVNVSNVIGDDLCFATFGAHTRSSASFTAELKDFAVDTFQVCQPDTSMTVKADVVYTFFETNEGTAPLEKPGNIDFVNESDASGTDECDSFGQVVDGDGDNVGDTSAGGEGGPGNGIFDPGETWQFTCTKSIGGDSGTVDESSVSIATGHGIFNDEDTTFCSSEETSTAYEPATIGTPDGPTATPNCDQDEQRKVTITIE